MDNSDHEFLSQMVKELGGTVSKLTAEEKELAQRLGEERIEELKEFFLKQIPYEDEYAFKLSLDHWDKKILWTWMRLERIRAIRAKAGSKFMIVGQ